MKKLTTEQQKSGIIDCLNKIIEMVEDSDLVEADLTIHNEFRPTFVEECYWMETKEFTGWRKIEFVFRIKEKEKKKEWLLG